MPTTAFVAPYAPHPCGVATFTYDLATAAFPRQIVALHPPDGPAAYPAEVRHRIRRDVEEDYALVAQNLNESVVDIVALQHEHGQWGGSEGRYVLTLVNDLRLPIVTTLHTVPRKPTPEQHRILRTIVSRSAATIVLSSGAAALLAKAYGVDPAAIDIIPHGVPHLPLVDPDTIKPRLGLEGRQVLLSFGLLGPGKGCEAVIEAMPAIVAVEPSVLYVIVGATHHDLRGTDGEAYRDGLVARVAALGLREHVRFVDRFMGRVELATWVEAADVVMAPYTDLDRVASGTLSYAMGAGRPVIATPFAFAKERLTKGRGVIAPNGSPEALAAAVLRLLGDRKLRDAIGGRAYADTRDMVWSAIGTSYGRVFSRVMRPPAPPPSSLRRLAPSPR